MNRLGFLPVVVLFLAFGHAQVAAQCPQLAPTKGDSATQNYGYSVAMGGDYDNDGFADYIVSAPFFDSALGNRGRVTVYSGLTDTVLHTLFGPTTGARLGIAVANAGDMNNDGTDDFMVSRADTPAVYVHDGATAATLFYFYDLFVTADNFGTRIAAAGDVNNDGFDDVIVGAHLHDSAGLDRGRAYVFFGLDTALFFSRSTLQADMIFTGEGGEDFFGYGLAGGVDVNNDGYDDLIIGAPEFNVDSGYVHVYSGFSGSLLYRLSGVSNLNQMGRSVAGLGRVDADSADDFAVGQPQYNGGFGRVSVVSGASGSVIKNYDGITPATRFGQVVSRAGDVDHDGAADLAVGTLFNRVWITFPATTSLARLYTGASTSVSFGSVLSGGGDANGDGFDDLMVGDPADTTLGSNTGAAYVIYLGDTDHDLFEDFCDNCPATSNPDQADTNGNSIGDICEVPDSLFFYLFSPVDMVVTDPAGDSIGVDSATRTIFNTILNGSSYDTLSDFNSDTDPDDIVSIPNPIAGDYQVRIIREDGVPDSAQFTLAIRINGNQLLEPEAYQNAEVSALGTTLPDTYTWTAATTLPGDANADGITNSSDIIFLVNRVFKGGPATPVPGHGDVNCDGVETSTDIIYLVNYVFKGGPPPCSQTGG